MAKLSKRLLGVFVAMCMLASLFTCMIGIQVSADGTTPDLVEFKGTDWVCLRYTKSWSTIQAGNYRFEMDCKIESGVPCIQFGTDQTGTAIDGQTNYVETYDSENFKYIITFTMTADWSGNLGGIVGNYGAGNRKGDTTGDAVFACANPTLYLLDGEGNPTGSSLINTFASDYYSDGRAGDKWNRRNFSSTTATCTSPIPDGFFSPEPATVVSDLVTFDHTQNNYSRFLYRAPYKTQAAGNYRFTMKCKISSGTPTINVGSADNGGNSFTHTDAFKNYTATYDAENYKYTITFTFDEAFSGNDRIGVLVGNYGTDGDFACAYPELYLLDGDGNPTGDNLINTFASDYYSSSAAMLKWERRGSYTCSEIPEGFFDPSVACTHESKHLVEAVDSTCTTPGHDDYYACDNCDAIFDSEDNEITLADVEWELDPDVHEDEEVIPELPSTCKTHGHTAYVVCSGCGAILQGSNDELPLDPDNHAGEGTEIRDAVKATDHSTGYTGDTYCLGCGVKLKSGEETPVIIKRMYHFLPGEDGYQVICYKMSGTFPAGKYRFTVDELAVTGVKSYVSLRVKGPDYGTSVEKVTDSDVLDTENNKRTIVFQLWSEKTDGALIMIGNYGNGTNMETYYANPELYLLDAEDNPTGENRLGEFTEDNSVLKYNTSRANAEVGKWTGLNWTSARIQLENYNPVTFGSNCEHFVKTPVEAKASTCKTQGNIAYVACEACGAYFDAEGAELNADQVLLPLDPENHEGEGTETRDKVAATRTTDGYSGDIYCLGCDAKLEDGAVIYAGSWLHRMLGWSGETVKSYTRLLYRPDSGALEPGATYTFSMDLDLQNPEDEAYFWRIYYRTNSNSNGFTRIPHDNFDIKKTQLTHGYHYEVTFTVPDDCLDYDNILFRFGDCGLNGYAPQMLFANLDLWKLDGEGAKSEQIALDLPTVQSDIIPTEDGNLKLYGAPGEWYTVRFYTDGIVYEEQNGYFAPVEECAHEHTFAEGAVAATCTSTGRTGTVYCADCYAIIAEDAETPVAAHNTGEWISDANGHHRHCADCDRDVDAGEHTYEWVITKEATAEENGLREEICSVCGYKSGNSEEIIYSQHKPGDINGDGSLNNKDLTRLFQYLSDWDVEVDESALDINGDGSVNNKDLTRLFQYLSDWDVEIF